jgi:ABC-type multidrug transport system fused ATPase/permease subunit
MIYKLAKDFLLLGSRSREERILKEDMKLLVIYLKHYRWRVIGALALAATNQIFSLMDPYIFRKIIDDVAAVYRSNTHTMDQFIAAIWPLALASVGVAFVSRVAKNFQDYFTNIIIQRVGANMYTNGIKKALDLPYQDFEDQTLEDNPQINKMTFSLPNEDSDFDGNKLYSTALEGGSAHTAYFVRSCFNPRFFHSCFFFSNNSICFFDNFSNIIFLINLSLCS